MLEVLNLPDDLRRRLEEARSGGTTLTLEDLDVLRDLCGERLQTHGFKSDYEPTEEGRRLERLIDELFTG